MVKFLLLKPLEEGGQTSVLTVLTRNIALLFPGSGVPGRPHSLASARVVAAALGPPLVPSASSGMLAA